MVAKKPNVKHDEIIDKIQEYIAKGTFKPNSKIFSENQLANILGTNRGSVRKTITALELLGIVKSRQGEGTFLAPFEFENSTKALSLLIMLEQGDREDIIQIRRILEISSVGLSAKYRKPEHIKLMKECQERILESKDPMEASKLDVKFHTIIAASTGNVLLKNLINIFTGYIGQISSENWKLLVNTDNGRQVKIIYDHHSAIFNAIKDQQPGLARKVMEDHLIFAEEVLDPRWLDNREKGG